MKFAERILYVSAGAHLTAGFVGREDLEWRTIYYGAFVVGAVAAIALFFGWLRKRRMASDDSERPLSTQLRTLLPMRRASYKLPMHTDVLLRRSAILVALLGLPAFCFAAYVVFAYIMGSAAFGLRIEALIAVPVAFCLVALFVVGPVNARRSELPIERRLVWLASPTVPLALLALILNS